MEKYIVEIAMVVITALITWGVKRLNTYTGIKITREQNLYLEDLAAQGVAFAAEEAAKYLKTGTSEHDPTDKGTTAANYVSSRLPKTNREEIIRAITVAVARTEGEGATKRAVK